MMSKELMIPMDHVTEVVSFSYGLSEIYCTGGVREFSLKILLVSLLALFKISLVSLYLPFSKRDFRWQGH